MKTRRIVKEMAIAAAAIAVIASAACESTYEEIIRPDIGLRSLVVQPVSFDANGLPVNKAGVEPLVLEKIPKPIIEENWDDDFYNVAEGDSQELWFLLEENVETARIIVDATPGTVVTWGISDAASRPNEFFKPGAPLEFGDDEVIYVQVATRDEKYRSYYRVHARLASPVTLLSILSVAGRETKIRPAEDGRDTWEEAKKSNIPILPVSITLKEGTNGADVLATKLNDYATVRYAIQDGATDLSTVDYSALDFEYWEDKTITMYDPDEDANVQRKVSEIVLADQDLLVAEVTAHNQTDKNYYKFRVSVGRIVNINKLVMKTAPAITPAETSQVLALGVPASAWESVVKGSFNTAAVTPTFVADITLEDEDATFEFAKITDGSEPGSFTAPDSAAPMSTTSLTYENKSELILKISSATKLGSSPAVQTFYKVRVDLQSAIITEQPKSNVYFITSHTYPTTDVTVEIDGKEQTQQRVLITATGTRALKDNAGKVITDPEPLEAKVDRTGNFTYQWYTANSWYGGYGFDKDGRIVGDPGFTIDAYHPSTERGGLDEKNNVSFHNGGNNFYRLPVAAYRDGWESDPDYEAYAISGATERTYTPPIDASRRPFIAGYSNQTQYYWVIIKDPSGREVISERATIVAEWGEVFDLGHPTGDTVTKKHHIVDLHAYLNKNASGKIVGIGLQEKPINPVPFKAGKHGDKYIFPITFPLGFSVMDYSVATCQAKFYLADGTVWIQNWTQGDVGFERSGAGQVLYYNLSNNNATLGLAGDSKEPQGADLLETPTHVVIKPAGEKPINDRPPFKADGKTPLPNDDAQGWFTPYIEIVELRFEGPARSR